MKKLKVLVATVLTAILIFALASCGAGGAVSGFVNAVKAKDYEKAQTYVAADLDLKNPDEADKDDMYAYIYEKATKSFKYKVEEEKMSEDEKSCTLKLSYSKYSAVEIAAKYTLQTVGGAEKSKKTVDGIFKNEETKVKEGDVTVTVVADDEGVWKLDVASAGALFAIIVG